MGNRRFTGSLYYLFDCAILIKDGMYLKLELKGRSERRSVSVHWVRGGQSVWVNFEIKFS